YDFGGQDYYHGLYQAFFSEGAVNVLFWEPSTNENRVSDGNLTRHFKWDYWLYQFYYKKKKQRPGGNQPKASDNHSVQTSDEQSKKNSDSILLVQTHADADKSKRANYTDIDIDDNSPKFNIVDMFYVSLKKVGLNNSNVYQSALQHLKTTLLDEIEKNKKTERKQKYYPEFLDYILKSDSAECVTLQELLKHYTRKKQKNESDEDMLNILDAELKQMHLQGLVLYYNYMENLKDVVWLNPAKTVEDIYKNAFHSDNIKEYNGRISENDFNSKVMRDARIRDLLINEKIVFHDRTNEKYIIPNYLPLSENDDSYSIMKFGLQKPAFVLKFRHFIPFGLINQLICLYGNHPDIKIAWRDQLIFTFCDSYKVWIRLLFSTLTVEVYISDEQEKESEKESRLKFDEVKRVIFLNIIDLYWGETVMYDDERKLFAQDKDEHRGMDMPFTEGVKSYLKRKEDTVINSPEDMYLSVDNKIFVEHQKLEKMLLFGASIAGYPLNEKGELNFASPENVSVGKYKIYSNNKNLRGMKKVFVSYSRKDIKERDEFIDNTISLQDEGLIGEPWTDEWIGFDKEWDKEIREQIKACDIMVCLISTNFMRTDYIRKVEVKEALKNEILVPIIIKPCDWKHWKFKERQVALKGKCISLNENDPYHIKESTDVERAHNWVQVIEEMRRKIFDKQA
ncbi:MAG: TIR domain-containing protein, partial [Tannerella sp.]|nr:TIR domain-containing protein [Tannerella sp.]